MPHEDVQNLIDVCCMVSGLPKDDVWGDKALAVKESKQHLFGPAGMDLGPYFGLAFPTWSTAGTAF